MKRIFLTSAALATAALVLAPAAEAQDQQRMSIAQIATMLEEQGYTVKEIELERGRYEVEMTDANGLRVEAYLDAATGKALPYRDDDDDHGSGRDDD